MAKGAAILALFLVVATVQSKKSLEAPMTDAEMSAETTPILPGLNYYWGRYPGGHERKNPEKWLLHNQQRTLHWRQHWCWWRLKYQQQDVNQCHNVDAESGLIPTPNNQPPEEPATPMPPPTKKPPPTCSDEFAGNTIVNNTQYFIYTKSKKNFVDSFAFCKQHKMDLAKIPNQEVQDAVHQLTKDVGFPNNEGIWVGATDIFVKPRKPKTKDFTWTIDGSEMSYASWGKGDPNNYTKHQFCVELYRSYSNLIWRDEDCNFGKKILCEQNLAPRTCMLPPAKQA